MKGYVEQVNTAQNRLGNVKTVRPIAKLVATLQAIHMLDQVGGLYRGLAAPLVGGALETGISYTVSSFAQMKCTNSLSNHIL